MDHLKKKIQDKTANITVLGLGYVGLPLAAIIAKQGFHVSGVDIKEESIKKINKGNSPVNEEGLEDLLGDVVADGRLKATTDGVEAVKSADIVFVVVQTPIADDKEPDLNAFKIAWKTVRSGLSKGKLLITESTIPPGTMKKVVLPILEETGLKAGEDFYLAYSPERAIPTRTLIEIRTNSRIVGGYNVASSELAFTMYSAITSGEIKKTDIETAEMVKVIENAYRDVNIAFANEIALLCEKKGIDAMEAITLANNHPRVDILSPGPGVGGHCIPKDPYFLIHSARESAMEIELISKAREINESMPYHILDIIKDSLSRTNKDTQKAKISILGVAYKGNTDDSRNSPSEPIVKTLMKEKIDVISHDPFVSKDFGGKFSNNLEEVVKDSDCIVVMADHDYYRNIDPIQLKSMVKRPCTIIDGRRILDQNAFSDEDIHYRALGKGKSI